MYLQQRRVAKTTFSHESTSQVRALTLDMQTSAKRFCHESSYKTSMMRPESTSAETRFAASSLESVVEVEKVGASDAYRQANLSSATLPLFKRGSLRVLVAAWCAC